jgi:hypothetical protein
MLHQREVASSSAAWHKEMDRRGEVKAAFLEGMLAVLEHDPSEALDHESLWKCSVAARDLDNGPPVTSARRSLKPSGQPTV